MIATPDFVFRAAHRLRQYVRVPTTDVRTKETLIGIATLAAAAAAVTAVVRGIWGFLGVSEGSGYSRTESAGEGAWLGAKNGLVAGAALGTLAATLSYAGVG